MASLIEDFYTSSGISAAREHCMKPSYYYSMRSDKISEANFRVKLAKCSAIDWVIILQKNFSKSLGFSWLHSGCVCLKKAVLCVYTNIR